MLDGLFELISNTLNFFYTLIPNYAVAIALLTCLVMLITTPLTLKGTRSMIEMQRLQPQIRRIQLEHKDDAAKRNEALMAFYKEHEINPVGGCLPLLIQAPVFSILFYVVQGLTREAKFVGVQKILQSDYFPQGVVTEGFRPKYLDSSTELYQSLLGQTEMNAIGSNHFDLSISAVEALSLGFLTALPYILLVAVIAFLSWYQQKQIMGRNPNAEVNPQQQMMMRIGPLMYVFFAFISPAAIGIYFLVSTLWRVGQQAFITRSLYGSEESIGVQAQKAMQEVREAKKNGTGKPSGKPTDKPAVRPRSTGRAATGRRRPRRRRRSTSRPQPAGRPPRPSRTPGPARRRRGSSAVEWVVTTGRSVEEATEAALDQLGVDEQDAEVEVVQEPQKGLFGRLRAEAQVRARVRPTAPRPKVDRRERRRGDRRRDGDRSRPKKSGSRERVGASAGSTGPRTDDRDTAEPCGRRCGPRRPAGLVPQRAGRLVEQQQEASA